MTAGPETRNHSSQPHFTMKCLLILMIISTMYVESLPITAKSDAIIAAIKAKLHSAKLSKTSTSSAAATDVDPQYYFFERKFKKYFRKGKKGRKVQKNKHHTVVHRH